MTTADTLVLSYPQRFEHCRVARRGVGSGDGAQRVAACSLCGTDNDQCTGHLPTRYGFVAALEVAGAI